VRYHCNCGDLLAVAHDLERLRFAFPDLRERFAARAGSTQFPYSSGVWRFHEMILPDLPMADIVSKPEGNTNLYRTAKLSRAFQTDNLYLKHEGENPTLSFKDRGMTTGVSWAKHLGMKIVACASTGDTSAAMAAYAAQVDDLRGVVFLPHNKISPEQTGAGHRLRRNYPGAGHRFRRLHAPGAAGRRTLSDLPAQLDESLRIEGQKSIGLEAIAQLGWRVPDWFVIPVGNAGNLSALGKGLREAYALGVIDRLPRIAAIQAQAADPFYRSYLTSSTKRSLLPPRRRWPAPSASARRSVTKKPRGWSPSSTASSRKRPKRS
jgi:threonine synthase